MIQFSTKYRSQQAEIMDDFELQGDEMKILLTDLKRVNKWLGGNRITIDGIIKLLAEHAKKDTITILDIGCGDGAMLRECAYFAEKRGYTFDLIGIDANAHILKEAKKRSKNFKNISFKQLNVFSENLNEISFDIALCTLFVHHLTDTEIKLTLNRLLAKVKVGLVVNDLQRSRIAYWLFSIFSNLFLKTKIARHDGLVSIAKGFRRKEIKLLSKEIKNSRSDISWRWAFRYQWTLKKLDERKNNHSS